MSIWNSCKNIVYFGPRLLLVAAFMALLLIMVLGNFDLFEPYLLPLHLAQGRVASYGSAITMGPFPQSYQLERLKKERGIDLDISLLNNDLPQEKALNAQLAKEAQRLGIEFKSYPLSYLRMQGTANTKTIAGLAEFIRGHGSRRIYIHCYLGRHRVIAVRDELARQGLIRGAGASERK